MCPPGGRDGHVWNLARLTSHTIDFACFPSSARRGHPRNRRSVIALVLEAADPSHEHADPSEKTRLKVAPWPKNCWVRLTPQTHSVHLVLCTDASCTLSVHGPVNGRRRAATRAPFAVMLGPAAASTVGAAAWQACHRCCVGAVCVSCCLFARPCSRLSIAPSRVKREPFFGKKSTFLDPRSNKIRCCAAALAGRKKRVKKGRFQGENFELVTATLFEDKNRLGTLVMMWACRTTPEAGAPRELIAQKKWTKFVGFFGQ